MSNTWRHYTKRPDSIEGESYLMSLTATVQNIPNAVQISVGNCFIILGKEQLEDLKYQIERRLNGEVSATRWDDEVTVDWEGYFLSEEVDS